MAKGRRERDRPKAVPNALYDPNKRVKLSYDSDEAEEGAEEQPASTLKTSAVKTTAKDDRHDLKVNDPSEIQEDAPAGESTANDGNGPNEAANEALDEARAQHEQQTEDPLSTKGRQRDIFTGQLYALGSPVRDGTDGEGSPDSAMEYLRAVRSERETLPAVLTAATTTTRKERHSSAAHYFDNDEAFIAAPDTPKQERSPTDPREVFTEALKRRFMQQRRMLHLPPSADALTALDDKHPISYPLDNNKAKAEWLKMLASTAPMPAQVRSLDQDAALGLLELAQEYYLHREKELKPVTSAWIWSLLARLDEVGAMNNDQVYAVRSFGKKAVLVQVSFRSAEAAAQLEELARAEGGTSMAKNPAEIELSGVETQTDVPAQPSKSLSLSDLAARENTLATLDSILVIVGDIFGQRDLLEFRKPWEVSECAETDG